MLLSDVDDMYLGALPVDRVMLGNIEIWNAVIESGTIEYGVPGIYYWTVPARVYSVTLQMIAGGGGGGSNFGNLNGGSAGEVVCVDVDVIPGEIITIIVGVGGLFEANGNDSSFGALVAVKGLTDAIWKNGGTRTTCYGTATHGLEWSGYGGGEAGFGNGGCARDGQCSGTGVKGAGGGAGVRGTHACPGGDGVVKFTF